MPLPNSKPRVEAAIAIVVRQDGRVLIAQRRHDDESLPGYWEFPGGKCEANESLEQCLSRELREEVDLSAVPLRRLSVIEHDYPYGLVRLHPFICQHDGAEPKLIECQDARWIEPTDLPSYRFPPANEKLIAEVIAQTALDGRRVAPRG
jgi:mutator protein MutT